MPTFIALPLFLALLAYCTWYWTGLTKVMLAEARYNRMKKEVDWVQPRSRRPQSRPLSKSLKLG